MPVPFADVEGSGSIRPETMLGQLIQLPLVGLDRFKQHSDTRCRLGLGLPKALEVAFGICVNEETAQYIDLDITLSILR